jgi:CRISPR-associated protein Csd1
VIAAFDAATTGRLSLTYYNELRGSDFLQRLHDWDSICCWWNGPFGIQSPALKQIALCAFGTQREEKLVIDDRVLKQQLQRLVACRVDRAKFPYDIEQAVVHKASNLQIYDGNTRAQLLFVACAVIKKYRYDTDKEEWEMALEPNKQDRSYQFGRLLAVLEKAERDTYQKDETREPNAIRRLSVFTQRPMETFSQLCTHIKTAYLPRLSPTSRAFYEKLIGEIVEQLSQITGEPLNASLEDTYLFGYYLQRNELYKSKKRRR